LTADTPTVTARELSERSGVSLSAVYRFLATFREFELIEPDPDSPGRFRAGVGLLALASSVLNRLDIRRLALRPLSEVQQATGATAFLTLLQGEAAICVEKVESAEAIRICPEVGKRRSLHAGAPAKILLAFMDAEGRERVLGEALVRITPKTVTNPAILRRQLSMIRAREWAITEGEFLAGACAAAVPIRDRGGAVTASLAIAAPTALLSPTRALRFVPLLRRAAEEVSAGLGYRGKAYPASVVAAPAR
jgi:DNA-binding IclR family transcriptional regulator